MYVYVSGEQARGYRVARARRSDRPSRWSPLRRAIKKQMLVLSDFLSSPLSTLSADEITKIAIKILVLCSSAIRSGQTHINHHDPPVVVVDEEGAQFHGIPHHELCISDAAITRIRHTKSAMRETRDLRHSHHREGAASYPPRAKTPQTRASLPAPPLLPQDTAVPLAPPPLATTPLHLLRAPAVVER